MVIFGCEAWGPLRLVFLSRGLLSASETIVLLNWLGVNRFKSL